jgi:hypothetical protein
VTSLYDKHKENWDKVAAAGFPNLAKMSKYFTRPSRMDSALGTSRAVSHWSHGRNLGSVASERKAAQWLAQQCQTPENQMTHTPVQTKPETVETKAPVGSVETMLLLVCPKGVDKKIQRVAEILGCEVIEV